MNRRIRVLAALLGALYLVLFIQLNRIQVLEASGYNERPDNSRPVESDFNRGRGTISSADGRLLAVSEELEEPGRYVYQRSYPTGELFAHITGSYSILTGADGLERQYSDELSGRIPELELKGFVNPFVDERNLGNLVLTVRADVQEVAREALGERKGSVVALDPATGGVLAMWSYPSFDPNFTSANDSILAKWSRDVLLAHPDDPLLADAYRDRLFPGSTFKVITAAAGLESGRVTAEQPVFAASSGYTPPLTTRSIGNFGGSTCGGNLVVILRDSCNTAFAELGAEIVGPDDMVGVAEGFGFNDVPPIDLPDPAASVFPSDFGALVSPADEPGRAGVYENTPGLALSSIGQGNVSATPLQMALVAAGVANGGTVMAPHVLDTVLDRNGGVVDTYEPRVWRSAVSSSSAATLRSAMVEVVRSGTATRAAIDGVEVGAKTGTAQLSSDVDATHAWMIAFAGPPGAAPTVAVAVVVEGGEGTGQQTGGQVAAPVARAVLEAALAPF